MKKFFLGVFFTLILTIINNYLYVRTIDRDTTKGKVHKISWFLKNQVIDGNYIIDPLTGRCSNELRFNGQTVAEYFGCDKFQRLINIEDK